MQKKTLANIKNVMERLNSQKSSILPIWKDITHYMMPSADFWADQDPNTVNASSMKDIYDQTAQRSLTTMSDGLYGYGFGSNNAWARLSLEDDEEDTPNEETGAWLQFKTRQIMRSIRRSNFYKKSKTFTKFGCALASAVMTFDYNEEEGKSVYDVIHLKDCLIMTNQDGDVDTLFTAFWINKTDFIKSYGADKLPNSMRNAKDDTENFKMWKLSSKAGRLGLNEVEGTQPWCTIIFPEKGDETVQEFRSDHKPFTVWRWEDSVGGNPWGSASPAMRSINDVKMLNGMMEEYAKKIQLSNGPLVKKTSGLEVVVKPNNQIPLEAGEDFNFVNAVGNAQLDFTEMQRIRASINETFYTNFFLVLTQSLDRTKTATEVQGLQEEQSAIMTSFLQGMMSEFLEPVIEFEFDMLKIHGKLDDESHPMPEALLDKDIRVDYISPMYVVQKKQSVLTPTRNLISETLQLAQIDPRVLHKIDMGSYIDLFASLSNSDMRCLISKEQYDQYCAQLAQQQAQQQQLENENQTLVAQSQAYKNAKDKADDNSLAATTLDALQQGA